MAAKDPSTPTETLADYTVANGRTVITDDGDIGPGGTVTLNAKSAQFLIARGFLLGPDGSAALPTSGPAVNVADGVQITPG